MRIYLHGKFQIFFGVLDIPNMFWRQTVDAGPNPTYEEKVEVPPPHTYVLFHFIQTKHKLFIT